MFPNKKTRRWERNTADIDLYHRGWVREDMERLERDGMTEEQFSCELVRWKSIVKAMGKIDGRHAVWGYWLYQIEQIEESYRRHGLELMQAVKLLALQVTLLKMFAHGIPHEKGLIKQAKDYIKRK